MIPDFRKQYDYKAFGIQFNSQIELPELIKSNGTNQVVIKFGIVPKSIENVETSGVRFQSSRNEFLLKVDGIANYWVKNGNEIIIEPDNNATDNEIRLFLLGSVFGALFHQRGLFPLHGSAIELNGECIVFSGVSGIGKSTIAHAFAGLGFKVLTDDICVITLNELGQPVVQPGYPQMKLWADVLEKAGENPEDFKRIREGLNKHSVLFKTNFYSEPLRLNKIYFLSTKNSKDFELKPLKGLEKFNTLKNNTYRFNFIAGKASKALHFKYCESIAKNTFIAGLSRPAGEYRLKELTNFVLSVSS